MKKNSKVAMDSDWEPVLKGSIYCSPACGGRCTKAAFDKAVLGAAGVVKALGGKGWQACIWENLGWHFKVVAGSLAIDCNYNDPKGTARYTATMYGRNPDSFTSKNPREAVEHLVTHCLNAAARSLSDLFAASEAASLKEEFYRVFTETAAVEFLACFGSDVHQAKWRAPSISRRKGILGLTKDSGKTSHETTYRKPRRQDRRCHRSQTSV